MTWSERPSRRWPHARPGPAGRRTRGSVLDPPTRHDGDGRKQLLWLGVSVIVVLVAAVAESALVWPIVALLLAALGMQGLLVLWGRWR